MGETAETLPSDVAALQAMVQSKDAEIRTRDLMIEKLKHQLAGHQRHRFGAKSETLDQLALDLEDREIGAALVPDEALATPSETEKSKPKRAPLPPHDVGLPGGRLLQCGEVWTVGTQTEP